MSSDDSARAYNRAMRAFAGLPGAELIEEGLRDLSAQVESVPSLLVSIGAPRLTRMGVVLPRVEPKPEHRLYVLLQAAHGDAAHGRYNALIRRLISFERALECAN
jgi:hypothetical protein